MAVQVYISLLSAEEFRQGAYDLGLSMQGLANVGNGRFFWAAGPYLVHGTVSILDNHFSWVYFAIYPLYALVPGQTTLFVVQAIPLALAAIPLQSLASEASGSPKKGLLVAGIYLAWAPMYAGMPNSFHLEAFLPVLFFSLVLVWYRKEYALGLVLAVVTGFTLDGAPILVALVALMFLTYPLQAAFRVSSPAGSALPSDRSKGGGSWLTRARVRLSQGTVAFVRMPSARAGIALIVVSIVVFFTMRYLEANLLGWLGHPGVSLGLLRNFGTLSAFFFNFDGKVFFWLVLLATVGFLPLLYPRICILLLPWVFYTFLYKATGWYAITSHYVAIAAIPLFLGTALGIGALPLTLPRGSTAPAPGGTPQSIRAASTLPRVGPPGVPSASGARLASGLRGGSGRSIAGALTGSGGGVLSPESIRKGDSRARARPGRWAIAGCITLIVGVLVANVALNPINPVTAPTIGSSGIQMFNGAGDPYKLSLTPAAGYGPLLDLSELVAPSATLLVQSQFYPLVANDPNAYPHNGPHPPYNPFNDSNLPQYVMASKAGLGFFSGYVTNLTTMVWNNTVYGVRGWVQSTRLGSIFLFERGYNGSTATFGPVVYPAIAFGMGSTLKPGPAGHLKAARKDGSSIRDIFSAANATGRMWTGYDLREALPAGNYRIIVTMRASGAAGVCSALPGNTTVLQVTGYVPGNAVLFSSSVSHHALPCGKWIQISVPFDLMHPVADLDISGTRPPTTLPLSLDIAALEMVPVGV